VGQPTSELGLPVVIADSVVDATAVREYPCTQPTIQIRSEYGDYPEGHRFAVLLDHQGSDRRAD
jgi:TusA-related sulfurtransferase